MTEAWTAVPQIQGVGTPWFRSANDALRAGAEARLVEQESKNPEVIAIYSEMLLQHLHNHETLVFTIVLRKPAVRTAEELIADAVARRARPLFRRHYEEES